MSKLVISSLRYVDDKTFENLSVSSHKWMHIDEVGVDELLRYLCDLKSAGYTLVGAEQTINGHSLRHFEFPKKTVLVLGNEKTGIPLEFLTVLDACVEIPQCGLVRSLNVHVTGAICVWEYHRQCMSQLSAAAE